jgi:hypothetical protein
VTTTVDAVSVFRAAVEACDRFEGAFRAGVRPLIEDYLPVIDDRTRAKVLQMLVEVECDLRRAVGETPSPDEYLTRFPGDAAAVRAAFGGDDLPKRVGGYELVEEIGRGGMGVVFRAIQSGTGRAVALKLVRTDLAADMDEVLRRFRTEGCAAALEHPHIVSIYDVGEADGRAYIAMRLVDGLSLAEAVSDRPLSNRQAAGLLAKIALAVHFAHQRGVLHRDLKPKNILLDVAGEPYVTDFGLARRTDATHTLTAPGVLLGTPAYMAPEQATHAACVGPAADIYSLGATLYHSLTGRPPFFAASAVETLRLARDEEAVPPRRLTPTVDRDLQTICLKCLEKQPTKRYASAAALADDLAAYLDGRDIRARPVGPLERAMRWVRRRPAAAALVGLAIVAMLAGVAGVRTARQRVLEARLDGLVANLLTADGSRVAGLLGEIKAYGAEAGPALTRARVANSVDSTAYFRAALASFPLDDSFGEYLVERGCAAGPDELELIRATIGPRLAAWSTRLRVIVADPDRPALPRLRAAALLVIADPAWVAQPTDPAGLAADLAADPAHAAAWARLLRPLRAALDRPLSDAFAGRTGPEVGRAASAAIAEILADDVGRLFELSLNAQPEQLGPLVRQLARHRATAIVRLAVWGEPGGEDRSAERRSNALLLKLALGGDPPDTAAFGPANDLRVRALFIHRAAAAEIPAGELVRWLDLARDAGVRQAVLLALGEYPAGTARRVLGEARLARLEDIYRTELDAGVRSAAGWLLRTWDLGSRLHAIDRELADCELPTGYGWRVNRMGMTEVLFSLVTTDRGLTTPHGPYLRLGPVDDFGPFAISATETTVGQYWRYLDEEFGTYLRLLGRATIPPADLDYPVVNLRAHDAERFCNWLSRTHGYAPGQWCYEPINPAKPWGEMRLREGYRQLAGYRLPTEAEWEYACQNSERAKGFFSARPELLAKYGWFKDSAWSHAWPVGRLKPNEFGLFDGWGNVSEWCADRYLDRTTEQQAFRGLSYIYAAQTWTGYPRGLASPNHAGNDIGFRVARSLLPPTAAARGPHGFVTTP